MIPNPSGNQNPYGAGAFNTNYRPAGSTPAHTPNWRALTPSWRGGFLTYPYANRYYGPAYAQPYAYYPGYYPPYGGYGYGGYGVGLSTSYGKVRIVDAPEHAPVYADGYYVGTVDDFNGTFQHLDLEPGAHHVEIRPVGQPVMSFDVNVQPGETITYHAR